MTAEDRDKKLLAWLDAQDREGWTTFVRYFAPQLLANQTLLCDVLANEAARRAEQRRLTAMTADDIKPPAYYFAEVLEHVGLKLVAATPEGQS